jgi:hypothetical protein
VCLDGVLGNEKLRGDLAIAEAAGDQGEDFELACRDAEGLLAGCIGSEGFEGGGFRGDKHFLHHDRFADGFATARDAEAEPDAEGREEDGDERAVELDGVLDDDEAVFGVLEGGDEEAADETEDEDVALHDGVVKKYNGDGEEGVSSEPETANGCLVLPGAGTDAERHTLRTVNPGFAESLALASPPRTPVALLDKDLHGRRQTGSLADLLPCCRLHDRRCKSATNGENLPHVTAVAAHLHRPALPNNFGIIPRQQSTSC